MAEYSIILAGTAGNLCNMQCHYCSAVGVSEKDLKDKIETGIEIDYAKMKETMDKNPIVQEHLKSGKKLTINNWGGDPLMYYKQLEEVDDWIRATYPTLNFDVFISTNGLLLGAKHIQEWIYHMHDKFGLHIQLSHDGVGQFVRSKNFDPFYDEKTKDVIVKLAKDGIFNMINVTLNNYNCSPLANFQYLQKWRYENHLEQLPLYIKLNHNNDSDYTLKYRIRDYNLSRYMHEMELLWLDAYEAGPNNEYWKPFYSYFSNQMSRSDPYKGLGGCGQFASGQKDWTWCMNTKGEYVWCQLCNDPKDVINAKCEQAEACKHCEFRHFDDCSPCPDMSMSEDCGPGHYAYKQEFIRATLRAKKWMNIINAYRRRISELENQLNNKSCSCNNKGKC